MKLHKFIRNFKLNKMYPLHMPGHKRRCGEYTKFDITEIPGFDDLHNPKGIIMDIEKGYSKYYLSKKTFISVNGSTAGILAGISTVAKNYNKFLVGRVAHKSIYNALYINNIEPLYVYPIINEAGIFIDYNYDEIEEIIIKNKIEVMIFTSPTYEGKIIDVDKITKIAKKYKVILIIDEAHGAHLDRSRSFSDKADICIQSLHKTLPALTSTALVHCNNMDLQNGLKKFMSIYQTSSPSYILLDSISNCLEFIEKQFDELNNKSLSKLEKIRDKLKKCKNLKLFESDDKYKLVIQTNNSNISGDKLYELMYSKGFILEMCSPNYVIAMTSCVDNWKKVKKFVDEILDVDKKLHKIKKKKIDFFIENKKEVNFCADTESIDLNLAEGRVSSSQIYIYPPGIPIISYNEVFSNDVINLIKKLNKNKYLTCNEVEVYIQESQS